MGVEMLASAYWSHRVSWLSRLIAPSPFKPLIEHQHKVAEAVLLVPKIVEATLAGNFEETRRLGKQLSILENECDVLKNRLRDSLPRKLFMQVSRPVLLDVLAVQDSIADACEDLGVLLTMREMEVPPREVADKLSELVEAVVVVFNRATGVVEELETLSGVSFEGAEATRVLTLIDMVDREEHLADKVQDQLAKEFFRHEDQFKPAALYLWMKIFNKIGDLANFAEKMTHRIRLFMAA
jgi:predicted phosphate transport protein (TIGR00153 family)